MAEITIKFDSKVDTREDIRELAKLLFLVGDELATELGDDISGAASIVDVSNKIDHEVEGEPVAPVTPTAPVAGGVTINPVAYSMTNGPEGTIYNAEGLVKLDSAGFPYDPRIHTKQKSTKADGVWKLTRGVDKALVETVQAEWSVAMTQGQPVAPVAEVAPPVAPVVAPVTEVAPPVVAPVAEVAPPVVAPVVEVAPPVVAPVAEVVPPVAPVAEVVPPVAEVTWVEFLSRITAATQQGLMSQEIYPGVTRIARQNQLLEHYGVATVALLANQPALLPLFLTELQI